MNEKEVLISLLVATLILSLTPIQAWTAENSQGGLDRRDAIGKISSIVGAAQFVPGIAVAEDGSRAPGFSDSFAAYNIIPDDSATLDPRLVKLDVS